MVKISFVNILFDKMFQNELIFMLKSINMFLGVKLLFDKWQFSSNTQKTDTISNISKEYENIPMDDSLSNAYVGQKTVVRHGA